MAVVGWVEWETDWKVCKCTIFHPDGASIARLRYLDGDRTGGVQRQGVEPIERSWGVAE